jgi:lipoyl(octanoyl) transferase
MLLMRLPSASLICERCQENKIMSDRESAHLSTQHEISELVVIWLGRCSYQEGLQQQEEMVAQKIAGDQKNYLLLLEHEPVYTIGRTQDLSSLGERQLPYPLHRIGRGGQATYHGPGQLVAYPIIDLRLINRDLHRYLRFLEEAIIQMLALVRLQGSRREGMTGVWIEERKIASLGVGVRKWISFHGLALNVCGDLSPFQNITPCGLSGVEMTSIEKELSSSLLSQASQLTVAEIAQKLAERFQALFQLQKIL